MDGKDSYGADTGLIGLDNLPRPDSTRERIILGLKRSAPFSSLQRRIIFFNLAGLAFLVMGVLYLNQFRSGLIEQRIESLRLQAEVIALTIAETAGHGDGLVAFDPVRANAVLGRVVRPTGLRAQVFDTKLRLAGDTRSLAGGQIEEQPLAAPGAPEEAAQSATIAWIEQYYESIMKSLHKRPPLYEEVPKGGISRDPEVQEAAQGQVRSVVRANAQDQLIVSVAVPIVRVDAIIGVLVLSTEGGDIDHVVSSERVVIVQVFVIAALVSMGLSILLANTIAHPIRRLAAAAEGSGTSAGRPLNPERVEIPDMTRRTDEIGELSGALIRMTEALYKRIEAIESFASDVAHEIKNPLTSLRSAVETMQYAKTPEQQQRLLDVIKQDVDRLDRLVTDISNASRLDAELVREKMEPFDLMRLVEMLADVTRTQGEERGVRITVDGPGEPIKARGLEGRIAQVITNLLDNALSFSPEGGEIAIRVRRREGGLRIVVEDDGPGVPPDNMKTIFERFYTERPETEAFGNHSGLGLNISRQIVEAHGGKIWVENRAPRSAETEAAGGARFCIDLPDGAHG
ncbi:MAG: stimulus-sensing domain-containing protein [Pseudomonadota bacterium]